MTIGNWRKKKFTDVYRPKPKPKTLTGLEQQIQGTSTSVSLDFLRKCVRVGTFEVAEMCA